MADRHRRSAVLAVLACSALCASGEARAEPAESGRSDAAGAELGSHVHDGFYLRLALGYGWSSATESGGQYGSGFRIPEVHASDAGVAFDVVAGGTPAAGLVLGGGLFITRGGRATVDVEGETFDDGGALAVVVLGPVIDWFPDPSGGIHVGALAGWAYFHLYDEYEAPQDPAAQHTGWRAHVCPQSETECVGTGFGANGWGLGLLAGYDSFVSSDWAIGGYARAMRFSMSGGPFGRGSGGWTAALMLTALHH